jgi:hypothetical protein
MSIIRECRKRLGPPPRSFPPDVVRQIRGIYNPLLSTSPFDSLMRTFFDQKKLREGGEVVWAQVIQANNFLFAPGLNGESHAATILHADPTLKDPSPLSQIAGRIVALSANPQNTADSMAAVAMMHPSRRKYWMPVPESLADGHAVNCSDLLIFRKLLPPQPKGATLQKMVFPLLVARDQTRVVLQVPSMFWPDEFLQFWESE